MAHEQEDEHELLLAASHSGAAAWSKEEEHALNHLAPTVGTHVDAKPEQGLDDGGHVRAQQQGISRLWAAFNIIKVRPQWRRRAGAAPPAPLLPCPLAALPPRWHDANTGLARVWRAAMAATCVCWCIAAGKTNPAAALLCCRATGAWA